MSVRRFSYDSNPDRIGDVTERFNRTLKTKMYKYFTKNNTYCYLDIINDLLAIYNNSVHFVIGMLPSKVNASDIHSLWRNVNSLWAKIPHACVKFKMGDLVRRTKQKVVFAKVYEQTLPTEIFRAVKGIPRLPQPVYQLSDLQCRPIEGQF